MIRLITLLDLYARVINKLMYVFFFIFIKMIITINEGFEIYSLFLHFFFFLFFLLVYYYYYYFFQGFLKGKFRRKLLLKITFFPLFLFLFLKK